MRRKLKGCISALLSFCLILGSISVNATPTEQNTSVSLGYVSSEESDTEEHNQISSDVEFVEGEAIVLYKKSKLNSAKIATMSVGKDVTITQNYEFYEENVKTRRASINEEGFSVAVLKSKIYSTEELIEELSKRSDIIYAEPNYIVKSMDAGMDAYEGAQWAHKNVGQNGGTEGADINPEALVNTPNDGMERVIALVDSGVDYTHEELADAMWINPYKAGALKGTYGYDFINDDDDPMDDYGHGTHCAGTMVAVANNGVGIAGVASADNIKLMALKIFDATGMGSEDSIVAAYNYIFKAQQMGINVVAINNSWGITVQSDILEELINIVGSMGAVSVCAAGNAVSDNDIAAVYPANSESPYVISVAASNENDELASFSNYGANTVDIAAPGTDILSTSNQYNFTPCLYENADQMCEFIYDFSEGNPVKVIDDGYYGGITVKEEEIAYGLSTGGGIAEISVELSKDTFFGEKEEGAGSLEWKLKGAQANEMYYLYLPYIVGEDNDSMYSTATVKVSGQPGINTYIEYMGQYMYNASLVYGFDSKLSSTGQYDISSEVYCGGGYADKANYWTHMTAKIGKVSAGDTRVYAIMLYVMIPGDYTINIDDFAVSKSGIDEASLGKYKFDYGTSMAAPHVTGAVAVVSNAYPDENAKQIAERVLNSVRKVESLEGKVKTGGVLDLSKVDMPRISESDIYINADEELIIKGKYLEGSTVRINDGEVTVIEKNDEYIIVDGSDYINKKIEITVERNGKVFHYEKFMAYGNELDKGQGISQTIDEGSLVTIADAMYFVNKKGRVYLGTPETPSFGEEYIDWKYYNHEWCYTPKLFGEEYEYSEEVSAVTDVAWAKNDLWTVVSMNTDYSENTALVAFDTYNGWRYVNALPEEMNDIEGYSITSYNNDIYIYGGYDAVNGEYSTAMYMYDSTSGGWTRGKDLPEGRALSKSVQVDDKLIISLGVDASGVADNNLIFDGYEWNISEARVGNIVNPKMHTFSNGEVVEYSDAQLSVVEDGIIYVDMQVEDLGDIFIYDVTEDEYISTGYAFNAESKELEEVYATTVMDKLYVFGVYTEIIILENYEGEVQKISVADMYTMPIETGFIVVTCQDEDTVSINGSGYYLYGDNISIIARAQTDYFIKTLTVNGEIVAENVDFYNHVICGYEDLVVKSITGLYVTDIDIVDTLELQQGASAQLVAQVLPENADNKNVLWMSKDTNVVTVDSNGVVTANANAVPGTDVLVYVSSADRNTTYDMCKVIIKGKVEETTTADTNNKPNKGQSNNSGNSVSSNNNGSGNNSGNSGVDVPKETTTPEENKRVPQVGKKIVVGKNVYRVLTNTKGNRTVAFVALKNKKATNATIPATIKIYGVKYKVTSVAARAFKNCRKLSRISVGKYVTAIGKEAFSGCKKLKKITIKTQKLTTIGKKTFKNVNSKLTVKVPGKLRNRYKKLFKRVGFKGIIK